jgi:hypothetical protein
VDNQKIPVQPGPDYSFDSLPEAIKIPVRISIAPKIINPEGISLRKIYARIADPMGSPSSVMET